MSRSKQMVRGFWVSSSSGSGASFLGFEQAARPRRARSSIRMASFFSIENTPITFDILYIISCRPNYCKRPLGFIPHS